MTAFSPELVFVASSESEASRKRRGPRPELSPAQIHNRRDQLVQVFEAMWSDIESGLRRCKSPDDLARILSLFMDGFARDVVSAICRQPTASGTRTSPRNLRAQQRRVTKLFLKAQGVHEAALQALREIEWAVPQTPKKDFRSIRRVRKQRRKAAVKAVIEYRRLLALHREVERELLDAEARFARQELFQFLKSRRYELNPLNLANAAAGLPYTGWRRSMQINVPEECQIANGVRYQIFKAVRYLVTTARARTEKVLLNQFKDGIPRLPRRYRHAAEKLAEHWMFVERAIRQACKAKPHPKSLPSEIMRCYLKQSSNPSRPDAILAQEMRLALRSK